MADLNGSPTLIRRAARGTDRGGCRVRGGRRRARLSRMAAARECAGPRHRSEDRYRGDEPSARCDAPNGASPFFATLTSSAPRRRAS